MSTSWGATLAGWCVQRHGPATLVARVPCVLRHPLLWIALYVLALLCYQYVVWALVGGWLSPPNAAHNARAHPARLCACQPSRLPNVCIRPRTRAMMQIMFCRLRVSRSHFQTNLPRQGSSNPSFARVPQNNPLQQHCLLAPLLPACCSVLLCTGWTFWGARGG